MPQAKRARHRPVGIVDAINGLIGSPVSGESGIGGFFRYWGGEALSHDRDPALASVIGAIGTPCLVEADVPIALLAPYSFTFKIVLRFLVSQGFKTCEPVDHEDRIKKPLPAAAVRRIIRYPAPEFCKLTGCEAWRTPISCPDS